MQASSIKEYTLIAYNDIEGALNKVLPTAITESLTELGVEPPMVGLIGDKQNGHSHTRDLNPD